MASRNYLQGILLACAAGFFWGSMGVAAQYLLQRASFEVFDLVSIRLLGAGLLLLLYETLVSKRFDLKAVLKKRNAIDILIYGLGLVAAQATFFLSIEKSNAATASLMVTTVPLFVTAWTAYAEKRAITRREWLSLAMAAIGVGCIVTKGRLDTVDFSTAGVIWGIVSAALLRSARFSPARPQGNSRRRPRGRRHARGRSPADRCVAARLRAHAMAARYGGRLFLYCGFRHRGGFLLLPAKPRLHSGTSCVAFGVHRAALSRDSRRASHGAHAQCRRALRDCGDLCDDGDAHLLRSAWVIQTGFVTRRLTRDLRC